jgi:hypothetical protein
VGAKSARWLRDEEIEPLRWKSEQARL